eukprot:81529_1
MQITKINESNIDVHLMFDSINTKIIRKLRIKEYGYNDIYCISKRIVIPKNKYFTHATLDIGDDHDEFCHLFLYDSKNTDIPLHRTNHIKLFIWKNKNKYPPINRNYKPTCVDLKTILKVKDEKNNKVNIYWSIPPGSYGDISYKITNYNSNDEAKEIVDLLPYAVPLSSIEISFQIITVARVGDITYESHPSKIIRIGIGKKKE